MLLRIVSCCGVLGVSALILGCESAASTDDWGLFGLPDGIYNARTAIVSNTCNTDAESLSDGSHSLAALFFGGEKLEDEYAEIPVKLPHESLPRRVVLEHRSDGIETIFIDPSRCAGETPQASAKLREDGLDLTARYAWTSQSTCSPAHEQDVDPGGQAESQTGNQAASACELELSIAFDLYEPCESPCEMQVGLGKNAVECNCDE